MFLLLGIPLGCPQCQDPGSFSRTYSLITPVQERVEFGDVYLSTDKSRQVAVRSEGNGVVHIIRVRVAGNAAFEVRGTTDLVLQPGVEHSWNVVFTPVEVADADATVIIENNSENRPELRIQLHARGVGFPSCDDGNPCTRDHFDPLLLDCLHVPSADACDDRNACTTADTCVAGRCLGAAVSCVDADPCTRDLCEATNGCVFINDIGACDDNEPCTAETCDPVTGCGHVPLPDGLPCAAGTNSCLATLQCQAGQCVGTPLPDGAPCTDFLACTIDDRCNNGVCIGVFPDDVQISAAAHSFGTQEMNNAVAVGSRMVIVDRNLQFRGHGGSTALTVVDTLARPVTGRHGARIEDEDVYTLAATVPYVVAMSIVSNGPPVQARLRSFHFEADGTLAADQVADFAVPTPAAFGSLAAMGEDAWSCATGVLVRWHLPELAPTTTGVPCRFVDVEPSTQRVWVIDNPSPGPAFLRRLNPALFPPLVESSVEVPPYIYSDMLQVLEGVGVLVKSGASQALWSTDGVTIQATYPATLRAASLEPGRALFFNAPGVDSVEGTGTTLGAVTVADGFPGTISKVICARTTCMVLNQGRPARFLESRIHGAPVTLLDTAGMGGFNRLIDVNGDVVAVSPYGAHKLDLVGAELQATQSVTFGTTAALVSWQLDAYAPVLGDLAPLSPGASVLGGTWQGAMWVNGRLDGDGEVLGIARNNIGIVTRYGRYLYGVQLAPPAFQTTQWRLLVRSFDTSVWLPGSFAQTDAASTQQIEFEEERVQQDPMIRVSPDGQRVLVVLPFVVPGNDNAVRFYGFTAEGTSLTPDWSARISTPGLGLFDAAYAYPDILLLTGTETFANTLEHHRYQGSSGSIEFRGSAPASDLHYHALLFYDGDVAMVSVDTGFELFLTGENEPTHAGDFTTLEPPTDLQVIGQRLWVTGRHSVEVFFPPCPPDIMPP